MRFKIAARFDIVDIDIDSDFENDSVAPAEMNEFIGERDFFLRRHCEPTGPRSNPSFRTGSMDCFVASLLAMTW